MAQQVEVGEKKLPQSCPLTSHVPYGKLSHI